MKEVKGSNAEIKERLLEWLKDYDGPCSTDPYLLNTSFEAEMKKILKTVREEVRDRLDQNPESVLRVEKLKGFVRDLLQELEFLENTGEIVDSFDRHQPILSVYPSFIHNKAYRDKFELIIQNSVTWKELRRWGGNDHEEIEKRYQVSLVSQLNFASEEINEEIYSEMV